LNINLYKFLELGASPLTSESGSPAPRWATNLGFVCQSQQIFLSIVKSNKYIHYCINAFIDYNFNQGRLFWGKLQTAVCLKSSFPIFTTLVKHVNFNVSFLCLILLCQSKKKYDLAGVNFLNWLEGIILILFLL
jgi:hypothetical protein